MLVSSIEVDWRDVEPNWLESARQAAADSGDLPRLSNVDLDVLALTIGLSGVLYTDDYRLQNVVQHFGGQTKSVNTKGAKRYGAGNYDVVVVSPKHLFPVMLKLQSKDQ